jgi:hypothetical protein
MSLSLLAASSQLNAACDFNRLRLLHRRFLGDDVLDVSEWYLMESSCCRRARPESHVESTLSGSGAEHISHTQDNA